MPRLSDEFTVEVQFSKTEVNISKQKFFFEIEKLNLSHELTFFG